MSSFHNQNKFSLLKRINAVLTSVTFSLSLISAPSPGYAQTVLNLPTPGTMIALSPSYTPAIMAGMTLYPHDPLKFDFMIDVGDDHLQGEELKKESQKLISYFMAALTVPEDKMWVNLSPYEKDRIIADGLGQTVLGQDMLAQDYILKQLTASMMYPDGETGKEFWQKVYQTSKEKFGTTDIPTDTFNKIWIIPERAVVYIKDANVFVADSHLKVMLEEDYLALQHHDSGLDSTSDHVKITEETNKVLREIVIPQIEKEVNEGKNFANLRQIYHALILATWYKTNLKESLLGQVYVNQNKTQGVETEDKDIKLKIYNQYLEAFKKGSYDYIKEDYDPESQQVIARKYFSGGEDFAALSEKTISDTNAVSVDSWLAQRGAPRVRVATEARLNGEDKAMGAQTGQEGSLQSHILKLELETLELRRILQLDISFNSLNTVRDVREAREMAERLKGEIETKREQIRQLPTNESDQEASVDERKRIFKLELEVLNLQAESEGNNLANSWRTNGQQRESRENLERLKREIAEKRKEIRNFDQANDAAMLNTDNPDYGGIDFNANNLNLKAQGDKIKFDLPANLQDIQPTSINGITPVIINITPITNFHLLIGLSDKEEQILTAQRG